MLEMAQGHSQRIAQWPLQLISVQLQQPLCENSNNEYHLMIQSNDGHAREHWGLTPHNGNITE